MRVCIRAINWLYSRSLTTQYVKRNVIVRIVAWTARLLHLRQLQYARTHPRTYVRTTKGTAICAGPTSRVAHAQTLGPAC